MQAWLRVWVGLMILNRLRCESVYGAEKSPICFQRFFIFNRSKTYSAIPSRRFPRRLSRRNYCQEATEIMCRRRNSSPGVRHRPELPSLSHHPSQSGSISSDPARFQVMPPRSRGTYPMNHRCQVREAGPLRDNPC